jgi:di/tricarboxylate transporter
LPHSSLIGEQLKETMLGEQFGISILGARRERRVIPNFAAEYKIQANDVLLLVGREERITPLQQYGLAIHASTSGRVPESRGTVFAEIIIPPRSLVEGKSLRDLAFRATYGFTAVALWRNNRSYRTDVGNFQLAPGDTILLMGSKDQLARLKNQHNFIVVGTGEDGGHIDASKVALTLAISLVALIALFIGVPAELAMLGGALALILFGLIEPEEAYSAIRWRAIFLIAGTISVSIAMIQTGLAQRIGDSIVRFAEPFGPMGLVAGAYLLSAALTQVMGGQISPLVVGPIAISAAIQLGVNPRAIAVVTAIAGSVAFITPLSHPVNILMIAPANYKFIDFVRSGWLLTIVCFIALMIAIPLFWQL